MALCHLTDSMDVDLHSSASKEQFNMAKQDDPILSQYDDIATVLTALEQQSLEYQQRDLLVRAMVRQQQQNPHVLWSAALITAFWPMLDWLRGRIRGNAVLPCDLDQLVILFFLEAVEALPLDQVKQFTCVYLRHKTQWRVFRYIRSLQREQACTHYRDWDHLAEYEHFSITPSLDAPFESCYRAEPAEVLRALVEFASTRISSEHLVLLLSQLEGPKSLHKIIDQNFAYNDEADKQRAYQRLKVKRQRLISKIHRMLVKKKCPQNELECFVLIEGKDNLPADDASQHLRHVLMSYFGLICQQKEIA